MGPAGGPEVPDPWGPGSGAGGRDEGSQGGAGAGGVGGLTRPQTPGPVGSPGTSVPGGAAEGGATGGTGTGPGGPRGSVIPAEQLMAMAAEQANAPPQPRRQRLGWALALMGAAMLILALAVVIWQGSTLTDAIDPRELNVAELEGGATEIVDLEAGRIYTAYWNESAGGDAPSIELLAPDGGPVPTTSSPDQDIPFPDGATFVVIEHWEVTSSGNHTLVNSGDNTVWLVDQAAVQEAFLREPMVGIALALCFGGICMVPIGVALQLIVGRRPKAAERRVFLQMPDGRLIPVASTQDPTVDDGQGPPPMTTDQLYALHHSYPSLVEALAGTPGAGQPTEEPVLEAVPARQGAGPADAIAGRPPVGPGPSAGPESTAAVVPPERVATSALRPAPPQRRAGGEGGRAPGTGDDAAWREWDEG